jgi:hypothetical protein
MAYEYSAVAQAFAAAVMCKGAQPPPGGLEPGRGSQLFTHERLVKILEARHIRAVAYRCAFSHDVPPAERWLRESLHVAAYRHENGRSVELGSSVATFAETGDRHIVELQGTLGFRCGRLSRELDPLLDHLRVSEESREGVLYGGRFRLRKGPLRFGSRSGLGASGIRREARR